MKYCPVAPHSSASRRGRGSSRRHSPRTSTPSWSSFPSTGPSRPARSSDSSPWLGTVARNPSLILTKVDLVDDAAISAAVTEVTRSKWRPPRHHGLGGNRGRHGPRARLTSPSGSTVALLGTSGSGKSSLVNALMGADVVQTGEVRETDSKGRHTTTWRELVVVPGGGALIDTPGLRELGMWVDEEGIEAAFADITDLEEQCRFNDCAHGSEPGCAVLAAIAAGDLSVDRLESYRKLLSEAAFAAEKNDHRLAKEAQKVGKKRSLEERRKSRP